MLTKPQAFYDNTHKQALGYQNPFYLKKAQRIKPTLYDGAVMSKTHVAMPVIDDEETLILEEESRSKMFEKAKDPEVIAKKISHKPIDYEKLNSLTDDFGKHVPSEVPKVSLVNASLKKFKFHLTQFDSVVKKRTTPSALEEDVLITVMNSMALNNNSVNMEMLKCDSCEMCLNLDAELSKSKQAYNDLLKNHSQLEQHCISLEVSMQLKQGVFQNDESCVIQNVVEIPEYFEINDLKDTIIYLRENTKEENTRVRHKEQSDSLINKLNLKSVEIENLKAQIQDKLDLEPLPPRLLQNREVHIDYLRNTQEQAIVLLEIVEQAMAKQPLDGELDLACKYTTRI
ncbi:hypothetical protein Tco_0556975 [Tanacetum coccineum]